MIAPKPLPSLMFAVQMLVKHRKKATPSASMKLKRLAGTSRFSKKVSKAGSARAFTTGFWRQKAVAIRSTGLTISARMGFSSVHLPALIVTDERGKNEIGYQNQGRRAELQKKIAGLGPYSKTCPFAAKRSRERSPMQKSLHR